MRNYLLIVLILLSQSVLAQRSVKAIYFRAPADAPEKLYLHVGEQVFELLLPRRSFSRPIDLPAGDIVIRISEKETLPPETPAEETVNLKIPASQKDLLFLTYPNANQKGPGVAVQPLDAAKVPLGEMMWVNTTTFTVGGTVGSEKIVVRPGEIKMVDAPARRGDLNYPVRLDFMPKGTQTQKKLFEGKWPYDHTTRLITFVTAENDARTPLVTVVQDMNELRIEEQN